MSDLLRTLHDYSFRNRGEVEASRKCGCYFCLRVFQAQMVEEWTDEGDTAVCPYCLIDAVLPDQTSPIDRDTLRRMHERWFCTPITRPYAHSEAEKDSR